MDDAVVTTTSGAARGVAGAGVTVFRGIPFAAPPVGDRRFRPPAPPAPWEGVRACTTFGPACPYQVTLPEASTLAVFFPTEPMDEDCLYLNVWTPAPDDAHRPVMVWIHGGAFMAGSGSTPMFAGGSFARDGVVLVTVNYRLHALGFLYLDELFDGATGTGNLGILDQIAALEWVRDNIAAFGGDPDQVTIFGESAGAMSVGTLLATPSARGLFRRAIAQSGAGHHNLERRPARRVAERVLELLEVDPGDWDALQNVPIERIVAVGVRVTYFEMTSLLADAPEAHRLTFAPTVDGVTRPDRPDRCVAAGAASGVDLIVGTCADEYRLFVYGSPEELWDATPIPDVARYFQPVGRSADEVLAAYRRARPRLSDRDLAVAVATDAIFTVPAVGLAEAQLAHHDRVWVYRFSWPSTARDGILGACHALEIPFVFANLAFPSLHGDRPPPDLARQMHSAWVRFAASGDPNGDGLPTWPTYDTSRRRVMSFDTPCRLIEDPDSEVRELWKGLW